MRYRVKAVVVGIGSHPWFLDDNYVGGVLPSVEAGMHGYIRSVAVVLYDSDVARRVVRHYNCSSISVLGSISPSGSWGLRTA